MLMPHLCAAHIVCVYHNPSSEAIGEPCSVQALVIHVQDTRTCIWNGGFKLRLDSLNITISLQLITTILDNNPMAGTRDSVQIDATKLLSIVVGLQASDRKRVVERTRQSSETIKNIHWFIACRLWRYRQAFGVCLQSWAFTAPRF